MKNNLIVRINIYYSIFFIFFLYSYNVMGQGDGFIIRDGKRLFPLGSYYMPKEDAKLKEMADAGFNLIRVRSKKDLDRAHSVGIKGWIPLKLQFGVTDEFKEKINSVAGHPALAIWGGPDELVHRFTASSLLHRWEGVPKDYVPPSEPKDSDLVYYDGRVHEKKGAWRTQTPGAVKYAENQASIIMPNLISAISYIRSVDPLNRQVWINETAGANVKYLRQYLDYIDITGFDYYPISNVKLVDAKTPGIRGRVDAIEYAAQRYKEAGKGKPFYAVLQSFSYGELEKYQDSYYGGRDIVYPSFDESRYMAYTAIAHGAGGINYWGAHQTNSDELLQSISAVVSELSALQPFLASCDQKHVKAKVIRSKPPFSDYESVSCIVRNFGRDWMIAMINETDKYQMDVVIENLNHLNGMQLVELYGGQDTITISNEEIVLQMKPREVKVLATGKKWETARTTGRDYAGY